MVDSCASRGREKLVGAATRPCAGRATLEWSRDCGGADLEVRARRQNVIACVFWVASVLTSWDKWRSSGDETSRLGPTEILHPSPLGPTPHEGNRQDLQAAEATVWSRI